MMSMITLWISEGFGQVQTPTTPDAPMYATNQACTSGMACLGFLNFPYAEMGNSVDFDLPYVNTGAFKLEYGGDEKMTWVTDYDLNDFYNQKPVITHWDITSGTVSGNTELVGSSGDQKVFDPDVVQMGDELLVIFYSVLGSGFPGNGTVATDEFRVFFETYTATDPPVSTGITDVKVTPTAANVLYAKNPNIDVSVEGQAVMVWEEQNTTETSNHVYAHHYDGTLSTTAFDLDPLDFDYKSFYNPDVACTTVEGLDPDDHNVYITFIGEDPDGNLQLLVYHATVGEIKNASTPSVSNLHVVDNMITDNTLDIGIPIRDYLYRPRIAAHPVLDDPSNHSYNIVVPQLSTTTQYASDIVSYTKEPSTPGYTSTIQTQTPASSTDIDCYVNFDPATDVNQDGYEVIWNADELGIWPLSSPNYPNAVNAWCYVLGYWEQTILRKTIDWTGNPVYSDYSIVPDNWCCYTYGSSVSYDRTQITGTATGANATKTFFGHHYNFYNQMTYYKLSDYTNQSLKRGESSFAENTEETQHYQLKHLEKNVYELPLTQSESQVVLRDVHGRQVNAQVGSRNTSGFSRVDLNNLPSGIYFLTVGNQSPETYKLISIN